MLLILRKNNLKLTKAQDFRILANLSHLIIQDVKKKENEFE